MLYLALNPRLLGCLQVLGSTAFIARTLPSGGVLAVCCRLTPTKNRFLRSTTAKAILETACYCVQRAAGFCLWANMLHQQLSDQGREEQSEPIRKSFRIDRAGLMNCYLQGPGVGVPSRVAHIRPSSVRSGAGSQPGSPAATGRTSGSMPGSPRKDEDADDLLHKVHFTWRPQRHSRLSGPWRARGYSPQTHISFWMQCHLA